MVRRYISAKITGDMAALKENELKYLFGGIEYVLRKNFLKYYRISICKTNPASHDYVDCGFYGLVFGSYSNYGRNNQMFCVFDLIVSHFIVSIIPNLFFGLLYKRLFLCQSGLKRNRRLSG